MLTPPHFEQERPGDTVTYSYTPTKKVFISFDFEHDRNYRFLLTALSKNTSSDIQFDDFTPSEIQSNDVGQIKRALTRKLNDATHELVVVGEHANSRHPDANLIGTRNWQWWEIEKAKELGKKLIAVKISRENPTPEPLLNSRAKWAYSFNVDAIAKAIREA